ncbi:MAG: glycosyltransferase family 4 protein [Planctomycetota bacterium]
MGKIKVLHIITRLEKGGAPAILLEVLQRSDRCQFEQHIATGLSPERENDMIPNSRYMGFPFYVVPSLVRDIRPFPDIRALISLYALIVKGGFDVVHCHTSKGGFLGRIAARLANARVIIYSPHGDIFEGYFGKTKTFVFTVLERFAARFTDKIITLTKNGISPYIKAGIGKESQFDYIYNGVDVASLEKKKCDTMQKRRELGIDAGSFVVVTAGRLVPVKGQAFLISAMSGIVKEAPNVMLVVLGDGELRSRLEEQARALKLEDRVLFTGMRNDVPEIVSCCDVFALPSVNEGFGVVLLEAMAVKCPIVATGVGGVPEVILDGITGILVPPKDPAQLAQAILKLMKDPQLSARLAGSGYQRLKTHFDIQITVSKTELLYKNLNV